MNQYRRTALLVGVLFITATLAPILSGIVLTPMNNATDLLSYVAANPNQLGLAVLLQLLMVVAIVSIPLLLWPVLRKHDEALAIGYLAARVVEVIPFLVGVIGLLLLPGLGQQYLQAGASDLSLQTLGHSLLAINGWAYTVGGQIIFALTALVLNTVLYQSRLVPRWLSGWGLAGVPLMLTGGGLDLFGVAASEIMLAVWMVPLALQEMVFAVWLMIKGFDVSASQAASGKTEASRLLKPGPA